MNTPQALPSIELGTTMKINSSTSPRATHIVLDLETLSTKPNAVVIAIGAVALDAKGDFASEFHIAVAAKSQPLGHIDADTITWWARQSAEAQAASLCATVTVSASLALLLFNQWMQEHTERKTVKVWGNGCSFDNVILGSLYSQLNLFNLPQPWSYWNDRDMRTILDLHPDAKDIGPFEGIKHHALHDARHEAKQLGKALRHASGLPEKANP